MASKDETPWKPNPGSSPPCAVSDAGVGDHRFYLGRMGHRHTELVRQRVQTELVEALTPVCVDKFNRASDAPARLLELRRSLRGGIASASYAITIWQSSARSPRFPTYETRARRYMCGPALQALNPSWRFPGSELE
jgi:hypothetical protein